MDAYWSSDRGMRPDALHIYARPYTYLNLQSLVNSFSEQPTSAIPVSTGTFRSNNRIRAILFGLVSVRYVFKRWILKIYFILENHYGDNFIFYVRIKFLLTFSLLSLQAWKKMKIFIFSYGCFRLENYQHRRCRFFFNFLYLICWVRTNLTTGKLIAIKKFRVTGWTWERLGERKKRTTEVKRKKYVYAKVDEAAWISWGIGPKFWNNSYAALTRTRFRAGKRREEKNKLERGELAM